MSVSKLELCKGSLEVSRLTFGLMRLSEWGLSRTELSRLINDLVEMGITTFDHADIYGDYTSEEIFGEALKQCSSIRNRIQLISKCGIKLVSVNRPSHTIKHYDTSRNHILRSVENSLRKLRTDRIDLLLIHRPDPLMNPGEIAEVFEELNRSGKVRFFGVSNFFPDQFEFLNSSMKHALITNQVEFSVMKLNPLQDGTFDICQKNGISPMAWSPLCGGRLFYENSEQAVRLREMPISGPQTSIFNAINPSLRIKCSHLAVYSHYNRDQ